MKCSRFWILPLVLPASIALMSPAVSGCAAHCDVAASVRLGTQLATGRGVGRTVTKLSHVDVPPVLVASRVKVYVWPWVRTYCGPFEGAGCNVSVRGELGDTLPASMSAIKDASVKAAVHWPGAKVSVTSGVHLATGGGAGFCTSKESTIDIWRRWALKSPLFS